MSFPPDGTRRPGPWFRFSPSRLALSYVALSVLVLGLFAIALWVGWRVNYATLRTYVQADDMQQLIARFEREGPDGLAAAIDLRLRNADSDEVLLLADATKARVAGNLPAWPVEVPEAAGTSGLVIAQGDTALRVVATHVHLPGGYRFLMGRESARFLSLVQLFWYGIAGALALALLLGAGLAVMTRRALLREVQAISSAASAIADGERPGPVEVQSASDELNVLARAVNTMLERLAQQNLQLAAEVTVRRKAELALHEGQARLEELVTQRTAELAQLNASLRRSETCLEEAQRLSHTGSFGWNPASGELVWSEASYELLGLDRQLRPTLEEVLHRVHPDDKAFVRERLAQVPMAQAAIQFEHRLLLGDGAVKHLQVRASALRTDAGGIECIGAVSDVTALKRSQALLAGEKRLLELVAKGTPLAQVLEALCRLVEEHADGGLCGIVLVELGGTRIEHGAAPSLPDSYNAGIHGRPVGPDSGPCAMAAFLRKQVISADVTAELRWAGYDWCGHALSHGLQACWSTPILSSTGAALGTFALYFRQPCSPGAQHHALIEQLTHLAGIAIERARAADALSRSEAQRRQTQRLEAMGTLAGGIAHDFNNILGAILGYGERALRATPHDGKLRRDLACIVAAGERGRALVDSVLTFSRSGTAEQLSVHVEAVVREVLDQIDAKKPAGVQIEAHLDAGLAAIRGDPTQVHQIVMNLAMNALQAMPEGGQLRVTLGTVHIAAPRAASIAALGSGDYIVLEVEDTGSGIAPELLERIFDPFFTTKEVGSGTGLGLSLVHGIVMQVGGAIDLKSSPGAGSRFSVFLPRADDASAAPAEAPVFLPAGGGQRILVVDDDEALVTLTTETLADLGYAPVGYTSSVAAIGAFRAEPEAFDAVITDERMPGLSGSTLIRSVRALNDKVPVVLLTAYVGGAVSAGAHDAGANEVLSKPLSEQALAACMSRVLRA